MRRFGSLPVAMLLLTALLVSGCGITLAADITPPPDYTPPAPQAVEPVSTALPLLPPDPAAGAATFAEKCAPCHGPTGLSDGEKTSLLPQLPVMIGKPEIAQAAVPTEWFRIVSEGNLERMMPGFSGSLDERQRWDVVAYALMLSHPAEYLQRGAELFAESCAECHAGGEAAQDDLGDPGRLAGLSLNDIAAVIAEGKGKMPPMPEISEPDRLLLAAYVRSLGLQPSGAVSQATPPAETPAATAEPAADPSATPAEGTLVIAGQLVAATGGVELGGVPVHLKVYAGMDLANEEETVSAADGSYRFEVARAENQIYAVSAEIGGQTFNSEILHAQDISGNSVELPLEVYASTSDASALYMERVHVFFDFSLPGKVQVVELFLVSNPGNAVVVPGAEDAPIYTVKLPAGAQDLQFDMGSLGERFVPSAGGFGDREPVYPGQGKHQVLFSYTLPYENRLTLSVDLPMRVNAAVVMLPTGIVRLESPQLTAAGVRQMDTITYDLYTGGAVSSPLVLELSGRVGSGGSDNQTGLLIGGGVLGVVVLAIGVWFLRRRPTSRAAEPDADKPAPAADDKAQERILDELLALENLHQAGKLSTDQYQARRAALMTRLRQLRSE